MSCMSQNIWNGGKALKHFDRWPSEPLNTISCATLNWTSLLCCMSFDQAECQSKGVQRERILASDQSLSRPQWLLGSAFLILNCVLVSLSLYWSVYDSLGFFSLEALQACYPEPKYTVDAPSGWLVSHSRLIYKIHWGDVRWGHLKPCSHCRGSSTPVFLDSIAVVNGSTVNYFFFIFFFTFYFSLRRNASGPYLTWFLFDISTSLYFDVSAAILFLHFSVGQAFIQIRFAFPAKQCPPQLQSSALGRTG